MRKPRTRSPRVVARKPRAVKAASPALNKYWAGSVSQSVINDYEAGRVTVINAPTFPPRHTPLSDAELAGLEIPAFLKRELPTITESSK